MLRQPPVTILIYGPFSSQMIKDEKRRKKPKKYFTKSVTCETLYLSRGMGPLGMVGIPPTRPLKKRG